MTATIAALLTVLALLGILVIVVGIAFRVDLALACLTDIRALLEAMPERNGISAAELLDYKRSKQ